ncbi:MAG: Gfo/Idh/MocA family protein [Planctomycetota bacterium]
MSTSPIRVGIVGAGGVARRHAAAWNRSDRAELVGFTDLEQAKATAHATTYGGRACGSLQELLDGSDVDLVDICTKEVHHAEPALAALAAGMPVLCEKIMAGNMRDGWRMVRAARQQAGVFTAMQYNYRSIPGLAELIAMTQDQRYGDLRQLTITCAQSTYDHLLDSALAMLGEPLQVNASGDPPDAAMQGVAEELVYRPGNHPGAVFNASIRCAEGRLLSMNCCRASNHEQLPFHCLACFERATVVLDSCSIQTDVLGRLALLPDGEPLLKRSAHPAHDFPSLSFHAALDDVARRLQEGLPPRSTWEDGWNTMLVAHASARSLQTGRRIDLVDVRRDYENDDQEVEA